LVSFFVINPLSNFLTSLQSLPHSPHIFPPKHDPFQESPASIHFAPPEGTPIYPTSYASRNPSPPNALPKRLLSDEPPRFSSHPMVTPTPLKKPKLSPEEYSRKSKSLGLLCENFCQQTWEANIIGIDEAARALGVERRRIYDIINILESLHIVERECKNRYHWLGFDHLPRVLATIQQEGILGCPCLASEARNMGVLQPDEVIDTAGEDKPDQSVSTSGGQAKKSLGRLSRQYLQLFLVGHPVLSLTDASDRIMGKAEESSEAPPSSIASKAASEKKVALTKEQKTKIRRLYDIANVLASIGLVQKEDGERRARPIFSWVYTWKPQQIRELFRQDPSILYPSHLSWRKNFGSKVSKDGTKISPSEAKKRASQVKSQSNPESQQHVLASIHQHGARDPEEKRQFEK
jgi:E2F/DP family winged-helix DNA-binding domain